MNWKIVVAAAAWPATADAQSYSARDAITCVAFWYTLLAEDNTTITPFNAASLDPETRAFYSAALQLSASDSRTVDTRINDLIPGFDKLRMDLSSLDTPGEDEKETARVWHGSRCNDLGETLPETAPFFRVRTPEH